MDIFAATVLLFLQWRALAAPFFNRVATFYVCEQIDPNCNTDTQTSAEILAPSQDGNMLIYTDSPGESIGFVDITDPTNPQAAGTIDMGGEPTSVAVKGNYALAAVNLSANFTAVAGKAAIIDMSSQTVVREIDLPGQPDSVAVSPDGNYMAIAIENERDEDLGDGTPPQLPAGSLVVMDTSSDDPSLWTSVVVNMTGLEGIRFPEDPEPEYVDINSNNICVVTLQENNGIALVDLATGTVTSSFTAGDTDVSQIDATKEDLIMQTESVTGVLREPDAVSWIGTEYFATADEGDLDGGSRGFTVFDSSGSVVYTSGNELEWWTVRIGHYPEGRSENKGNEPEGIKYAEYGDGKYLFVLSERSSVVFVYDASDPTAPQFYQVLPAGVGPEGVATIPSRNLLAVASEEDERGDKIRSSIAIYELNDSGASSPNYPVILSTERLNGSPIPFSALSGLASDSPFGLNVAGDVNILYTIEDSAYKKNRILTIDTSSFPYNIINENYILDFDGILADKLGPVANIDVASIVNEADKTVNIDPEGIAVSTMGGFWVVSEGSGTIGDEARPVTTPNLLLKVTEQGSITDAVLLPDALNSIQLRFGFEGVAEDGDFVIVAFQRAWGDDANPRLGIYNQATREWKFVFYPLDAPESQADGWVGLSDIAPLGFGQFVVLERDNQGGPDAAIKRIYRIDLGDYSVKDGTMIEKSLFRDILLDLAETKGSIYEKIEGLAVAANGVVFINNDNDGVDANSGENNLMNLGRLFTLGETQPDELQPGETNGDGEPEGTDEAEDSSDGLSSHETYYLGTLVAIVVSLAIAC